MHGEDRRSYQVAATLERYEFLRERVELHRQPERSRTNRLPRPPFRRTLSKEKAK